MSELISDPSTPVFQSFLSKLGIQKPKLFNLICDPSPPSNTGTDWAGWVFEHSAGDYIKAIPHMALYEYDLLFDTNPLHRDKTQAIFLYNPRGHLSGSPTITGAVTGTEITKLTVEYCNGQSSRGLQYWGFRPAL